MTIQEAIRSGKPFRRKSWADENMWMVVDRARFSWAFTSTGMGYFTSLDPSDVLADDWEVKS